MNRAVRHPGALVLAAAGLLAAIGCGTDDEGARSKADEFVAAVHAAGLAPRLTVGVAEALYGDDAAAVCDIFDGGLSSAEHLILLGNPSDRRHKTITDHSIEYAGIVIETYCPEHRENFREEIHDLDPFETDVSGTSGAADIGSSNAGDGS